MGLVYEGYDPGLSRKVAIKTILQGPDTDPGVLAEYAERFTREAKAAARLSHPNIVRVYDFGVETEVAYLVMEFVHGTELEAFFAQGERFDLADAARLMAELLDALQVAHEAGVVHRDIKPANIMVDDEGHAKLADFGVARVSDGTDVSQAGTMVGTPAYMSPEQIQGQKVDRRTDLFSAGVVLYQFLTGQKPFHGGGVYTLAKKILHDDPPRPSALVESVSPDFDRVIARALAKVPAERFQSADEFSAAIQAALAASRGRAPAAKAGRAAPGGSASKAELELWRSIRESDDVEQLKRYLAAYPGGAYAALAQRKIDRLVQAPEASASAAPAAAPPAPPAAKVVVPVEDPKARLEAQALARRAAEAEAKAQREAEARRARQKAQEDAQAEALAQARARPKPSRAAQPAIARIDPGTMRPPRPSAATLSVPGRGSSMLFPAIVALAVIAGGGMVYYMLTPDTPTEAAPRATPKRADTKGAEAGRPATGDAGAKAPASN